VINQSYCLLEISEEDIVGDLFRYSCWW